MTYVLRNRDTAIASPLEQPVAMLLRNFLYE